MAASKWQVYKTAKKYLITGDIDLDAGFVRMKICKGTKAAAVSNYARSTFASLTHIATAGISQAIMTVSGYAITSLNASQFMFDSTAVIFKATGSTLTSIQYAVIGISNGKAIAWCKLSSAAFSLSDGNTLTITPNASGYFTLGGGVTA
jgi:uncharacterized membrane protein YuzA (DUF378 family)